MKGVAEIFRLSAIVLFGMLGLSAAAMFNLLKSDIIGRRLSTGQLAASEILAWKRVHSRISLSVDRLNRSFGSILLIDFTFIFLRVTTSSFHAFLGIRENKISRFTVYQLMTIVEHSFQFWLVCKVTSKLRSEVRFVLLILIEG